MHHRLRLLSLCVILFVFVAFVLVFLVLVYIYIYYIYIYIYFCFVLIPFLQLTWHLWGGTWKMNFLLKGPPLSCHVSGREGGSRETRAKQQPVECLTPTGGMSCGRSGMWE